MMLDLIVSQDKIIMIPRTRNMSLTLRKRLILFQPFIINNRLARFCSIFCMLLSVVIKNAI